MEHDLGMGVVVRFTHERRACVRRNVVLPRRAGWQRRRPIASELVDGHEPAVEQLVDDGAMIELAEVAGKVEGEAGPRRDDDAVGSLHPVALAR